MATDLFNRQPLDYGGSLSADSTRLNFVGPNNDAGATFVGLVAQSLALSYQQPIARLYELGQPIAYFVAGRPQGSGQLGRVLGPNAIAYTFYRKYGDVCQAAGNIINICAATSCTRITGTEDCLGAAEGENGNLNLTIKFVVIQGFTLQTNAQDTLIREGANIFFVTLEIPETGP